MATVPDLAAEISALNVFVGELERFLRKHHPGDTRIIRAISQGTASSKALQGFAKEIACYSAMTLRPFAALVSNAPDDVSYRLALENFASEAGLLNTRPHPTLFRDFALGVGVGAEELDHHLPLASTLGAMYALERFLRGPFDEAIAGFGFAIEMPAAEWGKLVYKSFKSNYKLDEKTMMFWKLHFGQQEDGAGIEDDHAANARQLMLRFAATNEQQQRVRRAFTHSVLIFEHMLVGMDSFLESRDSPPS
jgi:pyrroloquinoline quinone (PQQ) biosynthesis protein C